MKAAKKFIVYFPVVLVLLQVLFNIYALIDRAGYNAIGFYLNTFIGTNILFSLFLVAFTFSFKFCAISRASAVAELAFAIIYLIIQQDNLYNILFQIIAGSIALALTYYHFINKFPLCTVSLWHKFFAAIFLTGNCSAAVDKFVDDIKEPIEKKLSNERYYRNNY